MIVYKITNKTNRKNYVGQTIKSLEERIKQHRKDKTNYIGHSLRKYGIESFEWCVLCECLSKKELDEKERYYIELYNSKKPNGYNLTDGGDGVHGWILSEETKKKISEANKGQISWIKGKHQTKEHIRKRMEGISEKLKGKNRKPKSEETKKKMSEAKKKHWERTEYRQFHTERVKGEKNPMYGTKYCDRNHAKRSK